jgi:hypothetical protein
MGVLCVPYGDGADMTITTEEAELLARISDFNGPTRRGAIIRSLAAERDALLKKYEITSREFLRTHFEFEKMQRRIARQRRALAKLYQRRHDRKAENARLRPESRKLRRLVRTLLENDPDDMAADGVTVLDVWRKEAREFFDARNKARQAHMEKMRADHAAEIRAAVRSSVLGEKE